MIFLENFPSVEISQSQYLRSVGVIHDYQHFPKRANRAVGGVG
jgi:hypothetical protein